ncbi:Hypothetical protein CINCED_3A012715 [Cinara cedri]|uniref:MAP kinase-activating death domain protein n=1 Tax=Cinara cedri TaxID=506608 RepID=A0A5E4NEX3_9HEMI|nr:Hypothetical protein CINCED_3A012715 [Cinara cedri]
MSESQYFCPRLIDYLAIVGAQPSSSKKKSLYELQNNSTNNEGVRSGISSTTESCNTEDNLYIQTPELLRRYPASDHKDFLLPETMSYFCQPEGCVSFKRSRSESNKVTSFVFTLTDKDTTRTRYGVCVNFYRRVDQYYLNTLKKSDTDDGEHSVNDHKKHPSMFLKCHSTTSYSQSMSQEYTVDQPNDDNMVAINAPTQPESEDLYTLTSLCLLSHHPLFSNFRTCLFYLKNIIDSCNKKINRSKKGRLKDKECIWSLLTGLLTQESSPRIIQYIKEIEIWILRLLSAPVPVPGRTKLEVYIFSQNDQQQPLTFALPDHTRFSLVDFPLHLPLELLGVDMCLQVLTIILLEFKVVFQSKDYNALSMSVMALVALMYPLQYMFTVIPLLPTSLPKSEMLFESPVPYVVGVPSSFFSTKRDFRFPKDVWIIDLDSNKITPPIVITREDAIPQLPKSESITLKNNLKSALNGLSRININNKSANYLSYNEVMTATRPSSAELPNTKEVFKRNIENPRPASSGDINININTNYGNDTRKQPSTVQNTAYSSVDIDSVDIAIRVAMVRFFLSSDVLANLTEHSRTLRLYPRPVVFFQINSFLKSRPNPSVFTCQLSRTQAVDYFAEWALTPNNVVFQRIQTGVNDPFMIGDKLKWFFNTVDSVVFVVWRENCSIQNILSSNRRPSSTFATTSNSSDDSDMSSSDDEQPPLDYNDDFKAYATDEQTAVTTENERLNIGPIIQGVHCVYEPPTALQIPMTSDDSPDDDGTVESIGSKSIGSSPSSSHSDMSSPMFKPESLIDIVRCSHLQQPPSQVTATSTGHRLLLSRQNTGGSDSALNHVVLAQRPNNSCYRPASHTPTTSEFYKTLPMTAEKKQSVVLSPPSSRKESLSSIHQQLTRQSSQNSSILEHFATQAKELVRETARQSSQEGAGGILAHVADKLTTQAKKAAGEASKSVHEVSKSAIEASKTAAGVSRNTFDDLTYVGKSTIGDLTKSAKQVASKKGFKSIGLLTESMSMSQQQLSFDDEVTEAINPSTNPISAGSLSDIRKTSVSSVGTGGTKEFFSSITNDINGLATQTTSMFNDLFGGNKQLKNNKSSLTLPVTKTKERTSSGNIPTKAGRNDLVEKSNLIRHSNPRKLSETTKVPNKKIIKPNSHVDNETFIKDVIKQILDGEGIGWLKLSRFKKLMEEEGYRNLVVSKLNRTLDNKISPSDHIDDVCISRPVWKGMLKALLAIIHGLEVSFTNQCGGGLASAFQVLEIAHTHFWTKDTAMGGFESQISSPYDSRENVQSPILSPSIAGSPISSVYQESRKSSQTSTSGLSECKTSGVGKFVHDFPLVDDSENPTTNISSNEVFSDLMSIKNKEQISTNPFLDNEGEIASTNPIVVSDESSCNSSSVLVNNPSFFVKRMASNNNRNNTSFFRSAVSDSELDNTGVTNKNRTQSIWSSKSSLSAGYRYNGSNLLNTASGSPSPDSERTYLYESILGKERSPIWNQLKFWEDVFIDAVSQERDMIGMDQGPVEMMERYKNLNQSERKRLEYDEDKLLSIMIYNLIAFMIMVNVPKESVMKIVRTMVGKSRVTNCYANEITSLMTQLPNLKGNGIYLKPSNSRQAHRQSFAVHCGDSTGELLFLEVRDDGLVLRSVSGIIVSRWWYERIVNMTYSPRSKIFCLWRTANGGQLQLNKYYTKKCKDLYTRIKHSMEKAAERGQGIIPGVELGGEFPVKDMATGEGGILQVCMEGVGLLFADSKFFVRLNHVRKCFTVQKKIFVLEEYNPKLKHIIQRQYESPMAGQICYAVLCVFSYIAAGHKQRTATIGQTIKDKALRQQLSATSTE